MQAARALTVSAVLLAFAGAMYGLVLSDDLIVLVGGAPLNEEFGKAV